jgi:hypothetical protein
MNELTPFLENLWLWSCDLPENSLIVKKIASLEELQRTEWDPQFEKMMRARLIFGSIRYGRLNERGKKKRDRCRSIRDRLKFFEDTGNGEWLVDVANMALLMFAERQHPNFHIKCVDDGYHDKELK